MESLCTQNHFSLIKLLGISWSIVHTKEKFYFSNSFIYIVKIWWIAFTEDNPTIKFGKELVGGDFDKKKIEKKKSLKIFSVTMSGNSSKLIGDGFKWINIFFVVNFSLIRIKICFLNKMFYGGGFVLKFYDFIIS